MPLLEVRGLRTGYGHQPVLHGVDLTVHERETAVILGLNGAGKTTTLNTVAGLHRRWGGTMTYDGAPVQPSDDTTTLVAKGLSVANNLRLGAWPKRKDQAEVKKNTERAFEIFPRLAERREQLAGTLSGGEQQMLAVARGLMASPRLLLIDEASLGLSPKLAHEVFDTIAKINSEGVTVLLVEQNAGVLRIATRAFIMQKGQIIFEGAGADVLRQDELRTAYLGA